MAQFVIQTAISTVISGVIMMLCLHYLQRYFDKKADAEEEQKKTREQQRKRKYMAETDWRQKVGRYLFWLYQGVKKPPPNGDLEAAKANFEDAEAELKSIEREELADIFIKDST